ncbi:MAG: (Fe-S)-binding protein [Oligoflexia bacterium]|nr:(Fe-S)-binding protein [Oligoflexia bacterium]
MINMIDTKNVMDTKKAKEILEKIINKNGSIHLNACVKCGLCGKSCHMYLSEPCVENLPMVKAQKVMALFRRYHTVLGKIMPSMVGAKSFSEDYLEELKSSVFDRCTGCGRCAINCSIGIDIASIIRIGRLILNSLGKTPQEIIKTTENQLRDGNQMSVSAAEVIDTANWLTEDLQLETKNSEFKIPVDKKGAKILYLINPREIKFFPLSLSATAAIFETSKESWTIASKFFDVTNYAFFSADNESAAKITKQVLEEAQRLEVKEIILSECGHGFRSFRWESANWIQREIKFSIRSILELILEYIEEGKIKVDKNKNSSRVTLHDPCNLVRFGGIISIQRKILSHVVSDFVEMSPNREQNFCCGGGGGMLAISENAKRRIESGKIKAEQIRATGAKVVATPCHNCADQLLELNKNYSLGVEILSISELVYNALTHLPS